MIKADKYAVRTLKELIESECKDSNVRARYADGEPATTRFLTQRVFEYNISEGEFPITTLRNTALKGAFYDIEAIYIKQTNILEEMHPSIFGWWKDFTTFIRYRDPEKPMNTYSDSDLDWIDLSKMKKESLLGKTYGYIINKYALMDKLLRGLEENPFGRRHIIDMWQYTEQNRSPKSLTPCAYQTLWSVRDVHVPKIYGSKGGMYEHNPVLDKPNERRIDLTLTQRSQDYLMTMSINPAQYVMLGMMVCNHLTFHTGIEHKLGNFLHLVQNLHMYERHIPAAKEMLAREPIDVQPTIELICGPKDFYDHTIDDFKFNLPDGIKKLESKLELAI